jgi:phage terminase small subunit
MARKAGLTKKEMAFCEYYVFHSESATQAYLKAYGCEYSTANTSGWKLLHKPHIKEYINELQKQAYDAACITAEKVALKLSEIAFAAKGDEDYPATAQLKALDLLQKQLGLQTQKVEADVKTDINIVIEE